MIGINVVSPNDHQYVENLEQYEILHTKSEPIFDQLVATAAKMLDVPLAMINFVDNQKVWRLSAQEENPDIDPTLNLSSIAVKKDNLAEFETIIKTPALILNPMIVGEFGLKFFASAPIVTTGGLNVGTVCIVDSKSKSFKSRDQNKLNWIASLITIEMNKRVAVHEVA